MQPANLSKTFCKLCLSTAIPSTNCQKIDVIRDLLEIVLPNVVRNLEETDKCFVCEVCSVKLFAAFNFKSICTDTEDIIFPYINASKMSLVDLKEVFLKEKGNIQITNISEDQRICRLCFTLITYGFVSLNEVDVNIIGTYIPQVNISATSHPVICGLCFDSLRTHGSFLRNCLDTHQKYESIDKRSYIKTEEIEMILEDDCQNAQKKYNIVDKPFYIKSEEIDIKVEEVDGNSGSSSYDLDNEAIGNKQIYASEEIGEINSEHEAGFNGHFTVSMLVDDIQICSCKKSEFEKYNKCNYGTKHTQHKNSTNIQMYTCNTCSYQTKYKFNLKLHQLRHRGRLEDPSEIKIYKCDACPYETKQRRYLKDHQLVHKDPTMVQMYECDSCNFETKYTGYLKQDLKSHRLWHESHLKTQMYTCNACIYQTKRKCNLKWHQIRHKSLLKTLMYTCDRCT